MSWYPDDNDLSALRRLLVLAHRSGSWISIPNLCTGRGGGAANSSRIRLPRGTGDADSDVAHVVDSAARLLAPEALRVLVRDSIHHASYDGSMSRSP
ncbi:hypothetical protein FOZ63_022649 [Perkinsus olseni]|uniref:Uncharacterized protein n=1 Tax=Perkinsus olseni TaxID=32597 RepID=A0A7J6SPT3_PEROL|nr:hypothetical protein FOZ62_009767 [Perkinsus olseni]KAF4757112.1 hypothetical protein FOZ63_022649 [Perkinsus olseni]